MRRVVLSFLFLSIALNNYAQIFCKTPAVTNVENVNRLATSPLRSMNTTYKLRVYFHVVRSSSGTGGVSSSNVSTAYDILNSDFYSHGIRFFWDGNIDYIDNDSFYNNSPTVNIYNVNNHVNGIDIYLYPSNSNFNEGLANGVGLSSEYYVSGSFNGTPLCDTHVISHEMGHVLNLWHTHHGTIAEGDSTDIGYDTNQCKELVNGSNSSTCGDYVEDTPADPYLGGRVNGNCVYIGTERDANNQVYVPDVNLIMSYTPPLCMTYFSIKQGERMRQSIENLTYLMHTRCYTISGPFLICSSSGGTYTITDIPSCYTINWSVSNSNFNIIPSGNECIVSYTGSLDCDETTLVASIYYNSTLISQFTKTIGFGMPELGELVFSNYYGEGNWIDSFEGNMVEVEGSPYYNQYECNIYKVLLHPYREVLMSHQLKTTSSFEFTFAAEGLYIVYIRGVNDCGYSEWSIGEVETVTPPDDPEGERRCVITYDTERSFLIVKWNDEDNERAQSAQKNVVQDTYEIQIWNGVKLVKSVFSSQQEAALSLAEIPRGFYIAKVIRENKYYTKKFAVEK